MALAFKTPGWLRLPSFGRPAMPRTPAWSWLAPKYPPVAFDLDPRSLAMVRIGRRKGETFIASFGVEEVPLELLEAEMVRPRLTWHEGYKGLVGKVVSKEPARIKAASLLLPDCWARVALLPFEEMPRSRADTIELIRHRMKKTVPFKVEDAAVDYQVVPGGGVGTTVLAVLTPRSVVEDYEAVFSALGIHAGLVDLSTFSLVNLYMPVIEKELGRDAEWLVANVCGTYFTFVIFRGPRLLFFRCKTFASGTGEDAGEGALRLLRRELQTSIVYYRDRLEGAGLQKAYLRVVDLDPAAVAGVFAAEQEGSAVEVIDPRRVVAADGRISGEHGDRVLQRIAPALGAAGWRAAA